MAPRFQLPVFVQSAQHFKTRQHPVYAVELAPGGLGVQVAARDHGRGVRVTPRAARKHIAHFVDADSAASVLAPVCKQITPLLVLVGEGLPIAAAALGSTDLRHFHEAIPQPLAIDSDVFCHLLGVIVWGLHAAGHRIASQRLAHAVNGAAPGGNHRNIRIENGQPLGPTLFDQGSSRQQGSALAHRRGQRCWCPCSWCHRRKSP